MQLSAAPSSRQPWLRPLAIGGFCAALLGVTCGALLQVRQDDRVPPPFPHLKFTGATYLAPPGSRPVWMEPPRLPEQS